MDDYELQQALESLAGAAFTADENNGQTETIDDTAVRWQRLFGLTHDDAIDRIITHRNNIARMIVSDEHWGTVRQDREQSGYDRETYEYEINLERQKAILTSTLPTQEDSGVTFLVELKGLLSDVETVSQVAGLKEDPAVVLGRSAETWESVKLCCIDAKAKAEILQWCSTSGNGYEPTILVNPVSLEE